MKKIKKLASFSSGRDMKHLPFKSYLVVAGIVLQVLFFSCTRPTTSNEVSESHVLPNIILIFADDLGYGDLSCFGNKAYTTPHLDQLAHDGVKFTNFYTAPVCTPARASLLTGCYADRVGLPRVVGPKGPAWTKDLHRLGLNPGEQTVAELLKEKEYATACVGKWHLGHNPVHLPTNHGFDEYFGIPYSNDMWPVNRSTWPPLPLMEGNRVIDTIETDQSHLTGLYTERALDFITRKAGEPFFLYLAHSMPHVPLFVSPQGKGLSGAGLYADVIREIDTSVGRIVKHLEELNLSKNTLVIFTSDNGPWLSFGEHAGSAGELREGKHTVFEGGVRVPFIAKWPAQVKPGGTRDQLAGVIDLLPTFADISGVPWPSKPIDGKSLKGILTKEDPTQEGRSTQFLWHNGQLKGLRKGNWKLVLPHSYASIIQPGIGGDPGQREKRDQPLALYDLGKDMGEENNLAAEEDSVVNHLLQIAQEHRKELSANVRPALKVPE